MQEQDRRELRRDFTTLTAGLSAVPFDRSNSVAAAGLDARTRLLERIQPRITSGHDTAASNGLNGRPAASAQMTPIQRLKAVAEAEVSHVVLVVPPGPTDQQTCIDIYTYHTVLDRLLDLDE